VSYRAAPSLAALPAFAEHWAIVPSPDGSTLTLAWGDACTLEELDRADSWNRAQLAQLEAARLPAGRA